MPSNAHTPPALQLNGATEPTTMASDRPPARLLSAPVRPASLTRNDTSYSKYSVSSVPPDGSVLTGKQEHCRRPQPTPRATH